MSNARGACALALLLAAACGEDSFTAVDATSADAPAIDAAADIDAAVDAAVDAGGSTDAPAAAVVATVYQSGVLAANIAVQYHAADGSHVATVMTNASGVAMLPSFPAGGSVTVPLSPSGIALVVGSELTTILDVQPGDQLTFGTGFPGVNAATLTITKPATSPSNEGYLTRVGCGGHYASAGATITVRPATGCFPLGATTFDAVTYSGNDFARTGYAFLTGLPLAGAVPNQTGTATFGAPSTAFASHTVSVANITQSTVGVGTRGFRNGVHFEQDRGSGASGVGSWSQTLRYADGFFDGVAAEVDLRHSNGSEASVAERTATVATASTPMTTTFDAATDAPGPLDPPTATGTPEAISWAAPTWQCRGAGGTPDVLTISLRGETPSTFFGDNGPTYSWTLLAPGNATSGLRVPALDPATIAALWPRASFITLDVDMLFTADSTRDWTSFRTSTRPFHAEDPHPDAPGIRCTLRDGLDITPPS